MKNATFDAVMLIQVFGGLRGWRHLLGEARRVLRRAGLIFVGRLVSPAGGLDAQMKQRLAVIRSELGAESQKGNTREDALRWLEVKADRTNRLLAAAWNVECTPQGFLDRHQTGASFSTLPGPVKEDAIRRLSDWADATFGSLDEGVPERHSFELRVFGFPLQGASQNE